MKPTKNVETVVRLLNEASKAFKKLSGEERNMIQQKSEAGDWTTLGTLQYPGAIGKYQFRVNNKQFDPINLPDSKYRVEMYENGNNIRIGCKSYDVRRIVEVLEAMLERNEPFTGGFHATRLGIVDSTANGKSDHITWLDAEVLLASLKTFFNE